MIHGVIASQRSEIVADVFNSPNLSGVLNGDQIDLSWTDSNTLLEESTAIEVSINGSGFTQIEATTPGDHDYTDTPLTPGDTYAYRVAYYRTNEGYTSWSNTVTIEVPEVPAEGVVTNVSYASVYGSGQTFGYKQYIPSGYDGSTPIMLIVWLHGLGERSDSNGPPIFWKLSAYGPFWEIANNDREYPFLMIAPQQPTNVDGKYTGRGSWDQEVIMESINHFKAQGYNVNLNKVYAAGQSMGGGGVFTLFRYYGDEFAAGFSICPTNTQTGSTCLEGIKNTPLWLVHNRLDGLVNISSTQSYINNMLACSPPPAIPPKATIYDDGGEWHGGWAQVFGEYSPGTLSSDANISIPDNYNEQYPETGTGYVWWEWMAQYELTT